MQPEKDKVTTPPLVVLQTFVASCINGHFHGKNIFFFFP